MDEIRFHVLADHVPGFGCRARVSADAQSGALAGRVEHRAVVFAEDFALWRTQLARLRGQVFRQEFAEVAFADETDAGGILLGVHRETRLMRQLPHLILVQVAEWKQRRAQLLLIERMQEISLVLVGISGAQQFPAVFCMCDARVVAGGDLLGAQFACGIKEGAELDLAIAQHVRIRRAPGAVFVEEMREHAFAVFAREVARMKGDAEFRAHGQRVLAVLVGAAGRIGLVLLPVLHEHAGEFVALVLQQQCRHRGIHATGHADHHVHAETPACAPEIVASGNRCPASQSSSVCSTRGLRRRSPKAAISEWLSQCVRRIPSSSARCGSCRSGFAAKAKRTMCAACSGLSYWRTPMKDSSSISQPVSSSASRQAACNRLSPGSRCPAGWLKSSVPRTSSSTIRKRWPRWITQATVTCGHQMSRESKAGMKFGISSG